MLRHGDEAQISRQNLCQQQSAVIVLATIATLNHTGQYTAGRNPLALSLSGQGGLTPFPVNLAAHYSVPSAVDGFHHTVWARQCNLDADVEKIVRNG